MRILITGGSGFIGSHIAEHYQQKAEVRVLDNFRTGYRKNLAHLNVELIEGDICDREAVRRAMEGVDYVFHLAAMVSVPESMSKITECIDINGTGMINVLEEEKDFHYYLGGSADDSYEQILFMVSGLMGLVINWHHTDFQKSVGQMAAIMEKVIQK